MQNLILTLGGLALIGMLLGLAKDRAGAGQRFIPVWAGICVLHFFYGIGVYHHSVVPELAAHVIVFGAPAGLAWGFVRAGRRKK